MTDVLGYRLRFGVVAPSTNTVVQPEYERMTPAGPHSMRPAHRGAVSARPPSSFEHPRTS